MSAIPLLIRYLGYCDYLTTWQRMQQFSAQRQADTPDELWLVEHPPVFTLGLAGRREHLLNPGDIPVIQVDRGGQVTYHGPGQIMIYVLLDLKRRKLGVRALVSLLEHCVITFLASHQISAYARPEAPGVYVNAAKIAALGLRIRQQRSYHGLAFNLHPDLSAFTRINPCGHPGLQTTSTAQLGLELDFADTAHTLATLLQKQLVGRELDRAIA